MHSYDTRLLPSRLLPSRLLPSRLLPSKFLRPRLLQSDRIEEREDIANVIAGVAVSRPGREEIMYD